MSERERERERGERVIERRDARRGGEEVGSYTRLRWCVKNERDGQFDSSGS